MLGTALLGSVSGVDALKAAGSEASSELPGLPISVNPEGFVTIQAAIGDAGTFRLLLDTGSNTSIVSATAAQRLGLTTMARASVATSAGTKETLVARLPAITIGAVTKCDLLTSVVDDATLRSIAADLDGVLGQDFLRDERYTLDYKARRLRWNRPAAADSERLLMTRAEDRWIVTLSQPDSRVVRMVPDTGASVIVLFDRGASLTLPVLPLAEPAGIRTMAGHVLMRAVRIARLSVGAIVLRDRLAVVVNREGTEADGVLPLSGFASVTFDPGQGALFVQR